MTTSAASIARLIVSVSSVDTALEFYRGILGLELAKSVGGFAWLSTADGIELLLHERESSPSDTAVAIGFVVDDVEGMVVRWRGRGGTIMQQAAAQPWGETMAVVRDRDGHVVCLSNRR
ncbi:VOC family protein [Subtercola sp. YIM 133946]|uniref:VOC family protein n=1 Tax=Subtercola sp. YIM 133946 TaxID=3118909 RepID=UPI002F9449BC